MMDAVAHQPTIQCVDATSTEAAKAIMLLVVAGEPTQIEAFLKGIDLSRDWILVTDIKNDSERSVELRLQSATNYRTLGATIAIAQSQSLSVAGRTEPPICENEGR